MNFDNTPNRRGTICAKWDKMEALYGVPADDGLAMWVADMEFPVPECVRQAVSEMNDHGVYGYGFEDDSYLGAISWWMEHRHGWQIPEGGVFTTHGIVNAVGLCLDAYTREGDGVVLFTPVYHAFARTILAANRNVVGCELALESGKYVFNFDAYSAQMTGNERMVILCSPHNPGGRVWHRSELEQVAAFAREHDLILVSDEIHQDVVFEGARHIPMGTLEGVSDRLVVLNAPSKSFNLAGMHTGHVIISDPDLRKRFARRMQALGVSANSVGLAAVRAVYSPQGAAWIDNLLPYLARNRQIFDAELGKIPGVRSMPLESTYLSWVDFADTGMSPPEIMSRVQQDARIAANLGGTFGKGGESFMRFNLGAPRAQIEEAAQRLRSAFEDLQ